MMLARDNHIPLNKNKQREVVERPTIPKGNPKNGYYILP